MKNFIFAAALVVGLTACGEKPQTNETGSKSSPVFNGTGKPYANPDWKQGDKASWEAHLKARTQYGQNDFTRMN